MPIYLTVAELLVTLTSVAVVFLLLKGGAKSVSQFLLVVLALSFVIFLTKQSIKPNWEYSEDTYVGYHFQFLLDSALVLIESLIYFAYFRTPKFRREEKSPTSFRQCFAAVVIGRFALYMSVVFVIIFLEMLGHFKG